MVLNRSNDDEANQGKDEQKQTGKEPYLPSEVRKLLADLDKVRDQLVYLGRLRLPTSLPLVTDDQVPEILARQKHADESDVLVTLDQAAAAVAKSKRTLEKYTKGRPDPVNKGTCRRGQPYLWRWSEIRPWLEKQFGIELDPDRPWKRSV